MIHRNIGLILTVTATLLALTIVVISSWSVVTETTIVPQGVLMMRLGGVFGLTMILLASLLIPLEPVPLGLDYKGMVAGIRLRLQMVALFSTTVGIASILASALWPTPMQAQTLTSGIFAFLAGVYLHFTIRAPQGETDFALERFHLMQRLNALVWISAVAIAVSLLWMARRWFLTSG